MIDIVDAETRSRMMRKIRGKDTKPEMVLRRALHARGFRYRLHHKGLPGRPDLVFPKYQAVIFVHGCFWHRHAGCRYSSLPSTRTEFWHAKLTTNVLRDEAIRNELLGKGWRVATVWECALRKKYRLAISAELISAWLISDECEIEMGQ